MLFILVEQIMNGTVTMSIDQSIVEGDTFEEAKNKIKALKNFHMAKVSEDSDTLLAYSMPRSGMSLYSTGRLENKATPIIG